MTVAINDYCMKGLEYFDEPFDKFFKVEKKASICLV